MRINRRQFMKLLTTSLGFAGAAPASVFSMTRVRYRRPDIALMTSVGPDLSKVLAPAKAAIQVTGIEVFAADATSLAVLSKTAGDQWVGTIQVTGRMRWAVLIIDVNGREVRLACPINKNDGTSLHINVDQENAVAGQTLTIFDLRLSTI